MRSEDRTANTSETCATAGKEWYTTPANANICLSKCPTAYTASWDNAHGAICNKTGNTGNIVPPTPRPDPYAKTADDLAIEQKLVAEAQRRNADVFKRDSTPAPAPPSEDGVLIDFGGGIKLDTTGGLVLIALIYLIYTKKP
jgi:hypothetical protein